MGSPGLDRLREEDLMSHGKQYQQRKDAGLCVRCGRPTRVDSVTCKRCSEMVSASKKKGAVSSSWNVCCQAAGFHRFDCTSVPPDKRRPPLFLVPLTVLMLALVACAKPTTIPPLGYPVAIVSWPSRPAVTCYVAELPEPPEVQPWPQNESDVFRRTTVHKREHDDLLNYVRDLHHWAGTVASCLTDVAAGVGK